MGRRENKENTKKEKNVEDTNFNYIITNIINIKKT